MIRQAVLDRISELEYRIRKNEAPGIHTYGPAECGHGMQRGAGRCSDCLRNEIEELKASGREKVRQENPSPHGGFSR